MPSSKNLKPIHKFNGGKGATLCHNCSVIITEGLTDDLYCDECKNEIWVEIPNTNGMIEVSNLGRCRSWNKNGHGRRDVPEMRPKKTPDKGYIHIWNGKKNQLLHRVIGEIFVPNPYNKPFINHKDGDKQNNRATNLEWSTNKENMIHAAKNDLLNTKHNIPRNDVLQIRLLWEHADMSAKEIGDVFGMSRYLAYDIGARRTLKHVS